ncbi:unnamed protein product, partial [Prorocentrum cordatum]
VPRGAARAGVRRGRRAVVRGRQGPRQADPGGARKAPALPLGHRSSRQQLRSSALWEVRGRPSGAPQVPLEGLRGGRVEAALRGHARPRGRSPTVRRPPPVAFRRQPGLEVGRVRAETGRMAVAGPRRPRRPLGRPPPRALGRGSRGQGCWRVAGPTGRGPAGRGPPARGRRGAAPTGVGLGRDAGPVLSLPGRPGPLLRHSGRPPAVHGGGVGHADIGADGDHVHAGRVPELGREAPGVGPVGRAAAGAAGRRTDAHQPPVPPGMAPRGASGGPAASAVRRGGPAGVLDDLPRAESPGPGRPDDDGAVPAPGRALLAPVGAHVGPAAPCRDAHPVEEPGVRPDHRARLRPAGGARGGPGAVGPGPRGGGGRAAAEAPRAARRLPLLARGGERRLRDRGAAAGGDPAPRAVAVVAQPSALRARRTPGRALAPAAVRRAA